MRAIVPDIRRKSSNCCATECGLQPDHFVADIASGTGLFTRLLLENGNSVYSVEPNPEMREMGDQQLAAYDRLVSVSGTAEETTLPSPRSIL